MEVVISGESRAKNEGLSSEVFVVGLSGLNSSCSLFYALQK